LKVGLDSSVLVASVKSEGEMHHKAALALSHRLSEGGHRGICSALLLLELPGSLASTTTMPIEKIYDVSISLVANFNAEIVSFNSPLGRAVDLMLEFRDLKRKVGVGSADFHHIATAVEEGCDMFVTTDEKHLLRSETKKGLEKYLQLLPPGDALQKL
jgi:predicted nucleic acid-binding protein